MLFKTKILLPSLTLAILTHSSPQVTQNPPPKEIIVAPYFEKSNLKEILAPLSSLPYAGEKKLNHLGETLSLRVQKILKDPSGKSGKK